MPGPTADADDRRIRSAYDGDITERLSVHPRTTAIIVLRFGVVMFIGDRETLANVLTEALHQLHQLDHGVVGYHEAGRARAWRL